jgi:uncharacterized repeat protein (TIGR01451 family)
MATRWVSSSAKGLDDGTSYANAWGDIGDAYTWLNASGSKGDIINIINDGTHTAPDATVTAITKALTGTSWSDPGFTIRGIADDDTETAEQVTFQGQTASQRFMYLRSTVQYVIVRGIKFDMTTVDAGNGATCCRLRDSDSGPVLFEACEFHGFADDSIGTGDRSAIEFNTTAPADWGIIRYCYFNNCLAPAEYTGGTTTLKTSFHHNVIRFIGNWAAGSTGAVLLAATPVHASNVNEFYNNTIYIDTSAAIANLWKHAPASGDDGTANIHSNFAWIDTDSAASPPVTNIFDGSAVSTATYSGDVGNNVIQFGPNVVEADVPNGIYEEPWEGATDPLATDEVAYEVAAATLFTDLTAAYTWSNVNSTGYNIALSEDFRPLLYTTSGLGGIVPGALPAGETDYTIAVARSTTNPEIGETVVLTLTLSNSGESATGITVSAAVPSGLTYSSHVAASGTYSTSTEVWTVASLASGGSTTLTITVAVDDDQAGNTITFTATVTGGNPSQDPDTSDNTDSVILSVIDTADASDPDLPVAQPYLDVRPLRGDDVKLDLNTRFSTIKNRDTKLYQRHDYEGQYFREFSGRRLILATNTTMQLNLGGIQTGEFFMLNATTAIDVSVVKEDTQRYWPSVKTLIVGGGDFEQVYLKNTSTTLTSTVMTGATD